jgi:hypothetical protein
MPGNNSGRPTWGILGIGLLARAAMDSGTGTTGGGVRLE